MMQGLVGGLVRRLEKGAAGLYDWANVALQERKLAIRGSLGVPRPLWVWGQVFAREIRVEGGTPAVRLILRLDDERRRHYLSIQSISRWEILRH